LNRHILLLEDVKFEFIVTIFIVSGLKYFALYFQDENQSAPTSSADAQAGKETEAGSNGPEMSDAAPAGEKSKKSKEEWVTLIFGEDGKEIAAPPEKSVYDLDPEEEDKITSGDT
jgi:hypothetical protein